VFSHVSAERGHALLLETLNARPLLRLGLRLGEGTGGVLAAPILRAAAAMTREIASLDDVIAGRL
jgi:nicotinate-nucleotide--dimethylbenzimidazole phosphoribosyltransferase